MTMFHFSTGKGKVNFEIHTMLRGVAIPAHGMPELQLDSRDCFILCALYLFIHSSRRLSFFFPYILKGTTLVHESHILYCKSYYCFREATNSSPLG